MTADGNDFLNPDEIDALLNSAKENQGETSESPASQNRNEPDANTDDFSNDLLAPDDIERLLQQRDDGDETGPVSTSDETQNGNGPEQTLDDAESYLGQALSGTVSMSDPVAKFGAPSPFDFEQFDRSERPRSKTQPLEILQDVELDLRIELGRTEMLIEEVVDLKEGSVVTLDKLAGDPVDILVNGRLIAKGEVLVLNDNFCVRVAEILTPEL